MLWLGERRHRDGDDDRIAEILESRGCREGI